MISPDKHSCRKSIRQCICVSFDVCESSISKDSHCKQNIRQIARGLSKHQGTSVLLVYEWLENNSDMNH